MTCCPFGCCSTKLLLGDPNARKQKRLQPLVVDINLLEEILPEAFAIVREAGNGVLVLPHFDLHLSILCFLVTDFVLSHE